MHNLFLERGSLVVVVPVVTLFAAIAYVKLPVNWTNSVDTVLFGAATGILIAVLIQYYKAKEGH